MASSKSKYIGGGATIGILGLLSWFILSGSFAVQLEGDVQCAGTYENPCDWHFNITGKDTLPYYIYNKNAVALKFEPDVKQYFLCKKDGRYSGKARENRVKYPCGVGYREFYWIESLTAQYSYVEKFTKNEKKEYKLVVLKNNPTDKIKFGGSLPGMEFDPFFLPDTNFSWLCDYKTTQIADNKKVFKGVTYEFTCPIGQNISVNTTKKFAICYNPGVLHPNGSYTYSINFSHFYDRAFLANRTMYWNETVLDYAYVDFQNTTSCEKAGFTIEDLRINYTKCGVKCSWDNPIASCDICEGDSNCDGILQPGESGFSKDISEENITFAKIKQWWRVDNGNNNLKEQLKNCVEKI